MNRDNELIRAILYRSSRAAADELVSAYYDEIYIFISRQIPGREDAMDLTQTCFISALRSLGSYDGKKASLRTWLYSIAAHKVIDFRRRGLPPPLPLDDNDIPDGSDFAARVDDRALLDAIEERVRTLNPAVQEVYRLRLYAGRSFPEIAALTGEGEAKVKARYYRLMERLRKEFG